MSEHSPTPDESQPVSWQIKQTVFEGVSVGGNLTVGDVTQTTHVHLPPPPKTEPKHFTVPYLRNAYFTGREAILIQLHETLGQSGTAALSQAKAISGLGGVGKTQTAVEYAYRYFADNPVYQWVLWVNASNLTLASSFASIATDLALPNHQENKLDENIAAVLRWLETNDSWLLIFDNVDDPQAVQPLRPKNSKGRILITSRVQRLETLGVAHSIALDTMTPEEAHEFLQRRTERNSIDPSEQQAIAALAKTLGYLPLALEQAAAYILAKGVSFAAYLRSYQKKRLQLLEKQEPQTGDYPESVATTWTINFEAVQSNSPAAADLLRLSSFLAPDNIPCEILLLGKEHLGELLSTALAEAAEDELAIPELLEELTRYSLIRLETDYRYSIHRMVQEVLQDDLTLEQRQQWLDRTVKALNATFPSVEFENWRLCDRLVEHVQAVDFQQATETIELGRLLNATGYFLNDQGRYVEAEPLYLRTLDIDRLQLGPDHPDTATSLNNLAALYYRQGRYKQVERLYLQSLDIDRLQLGPDHPHTAMSLSNLAALYKLQGRYEKAETLYLQAFDIIQSQLGPDHPHTTTSLNNLALLYDSQGRYEKAEPLYLQALDIRRSQLGPNHPDIALSLNNLAALYDSQGRYAEAEPLYLQALDIRRSQLGPNHPDIALSLNNLAALYKSQGRYAEAEPLYLQALNIYRSQFGSDHPDIATSLNNLAALYYRQGRYEQAEPLYLQALDIRRSQLGPNHPDIALSLNNLAALYKSQGRYEQAESLYLQALDIRRSQLGPNHPDIATNLNDLAGLYSLRGRYEQAEPLYLQALDIRRSQLGPNHPDTAISLNDLARLYSLRGRYEQAEPLYLQALDIYRSQLGPDHPDTATSLNNLAALYRLRGRYEQAEPLYLQALDIYRSQLGPDHPDTATSLNNLALLYESQGRYAEAEPLYLQTWAIFIQTLGENHLYTQTVWRNFIDFLQQVIAAGRATELSDHPVTQAILKDLVN